MRLPDWISEPVFERFLAQRSEPDWLQTLRRAGLSQFQQYGFPTLKTEEWKYTSAAPFLKTDFKEAENNIFPEEVFASLQWPEANRLVFWEGKFLPAFSRVESSLRLESLSAVCQSAPDRVRPYLGKAAVQTAPGLLGCNTAFWEEGFFLSVSAGQQVKSPIQCLFLHSGRTANWIPFRNILVLEENAQASLMEKYIGLEGEATYLTQAVTEVFLEKGAKLHYAQSQQESLSAFHVHALFVQQAEATQWDSYVLDQGGARVRHDLQCDLRGEKATCQLWGLYQTAGSQHVDNHTCIQHHHPDTTSRQYYKGVLADQSRAVFQGAVVIQPGAKRADAQQRNATLLLSSQAEIDTQPQLEIYNDEVKCTHGATVSDLSEEALFYLQSRGIAAEEARMLLKAGFMNEILDQVPFPGVKTYVTVT